MLDRRLADKPIVNTVYILLSVGHQGAPPSQNLAVFFAAPNILPFRVIRKNWYGKIYSPYNVPRVHYI